MNIGYLATSKAGHDKGKVFVIIAEENEYLWIADGKARTVLHPKKKKKKHVQIIKVLEDDHVIQSLKDGKTVKEEDIRRIIKLYLNKQRNA
ncbi:MAG: hypothetical protein IKW28_10405 [Lachnospiraceae bacterium]|nr:hypothetical protein [Lachnospiraceae bacterium]